MAIKKFEKKVDLKKKNFNTLDRREDYDQYKSVKISEIVDKLIESKLEEKIEQIQKNQEDKIKDVSPRYFSFYGYANHISMNQDFYYSACII